ncbi:MAG: KOW domain-containing RNA-binding protein [Bacillota bacterium]|nr:KOW domain-containing RNA-binding protein [Bacillota bacterium]
MKESNLEVGQLVCSKRGRDRGKFFLVVEIIDDSSVYLVDGDKRRLENPKRKNIKHLDSFPVVAEHLAALWKGGQQVGNSEIRKAIATLRQVQVDKESETRG